MLIGRGEHESGRQLLLVGLSAENICRLQLGEPINRDLTQQGFQLQLVVHYGKDEETIAKEIMTCLDLPAQPSEELTDALKTPRPSTKLGPASDYYSLNSKNGNIELSLDGASRIVLTAQEALVLASKLQKCAALESN